MSENVKHVSDATFDTEVLQSQTPVLVDYWAEWCGPCKMIAPVLEDMAKSYAGRLTVAKLDIDANPGITSKFLII
jgi:thioredoxin 1